MQRTGGDIHVLPPGLRQEVSAYGHSSLAIVQWTAHGVLSERQSSGPVTLSEQGTDFSSKKSQVNLRGAVAMCLLLLREGSACPRRTFLQRHYPGALRPKATLPTHVDPNPLSATNHVVVPTSPAVPNIATLQAQYGDLLSRWRGFFACLAPPSVTAGEPVG